MKTVLAHGAQRERPSELGVEANVMLIRTACIDIAREGWVLHGANAPAGPRARHEYLIRQRRAGIPTASMRVGDAGGHRPTSSIAASRCARRCASPFSRGDNGQSANVSCRTAQRVRAQKH